MPVWHLLSLCQPSPCTGFVPLVVELDGPVLVDSGLWPKPLDSSPHINEISVAVTDDLEINEEIVDRSTFEIRDEEFKLKVWYY